MNCGQLSIYNRKHLERYSLKSFVHDCIKERVCATTSQAKNILDVLISVNGSQFPLTSAVSRRHMNLKKTRQIDASYDRGRMALGGTLEKHSSVSIHQINLGFV